MLNTSTCKTHDDTTNDDGGHVRRSTSDGGADDEDEAEEDEDPSHVEDEEDFAREAEGGEEGERVREADPWEELDGAEGLVDSRLDIGDVADIVAYRDELVMGRVEMNDG